MFNASMRRVFRSACVQAKLNFRPFLSVEYFFLALITDNFNETKNMLLDCGVHIESLCSNLKDACQIETSMTPDGDGEHLHNSAILEKVIRIAFLSKDLRTGAASRISELDFIIGVVTNDESNTAAFLFAQGITQETVTSYARYGSKRKILK